MHFLAQARLRHIRYLDWFQDLFETGSGLVSLVLVVEDVRPGKTAGVKKVHIPETWITLKQVESANDGMSTFLIRSGIIGVLV